MSCATACNPISRNISTSFRADDASRSRFTTQRPLIIAAPCSAETRNFACRRASNSASLLAASRVPVSATCNRRESGEFMATDVSELSFSRKECTQVAIAPERKL
jgi:hypothetical protein